jgi:hypothetical protein
VFVAQLTLVAMFGGASVCWTLALFPGPGRELLWWWLRRLAWAVMATIGATFILSWLAITVTAALNATTDFSIIQRCLVALLIVAFAFRLRSQIARQVESLSHRFGARVAQQLGQPSTAPAVAAGAALGVGLSALARSWAADTPGGQYAYNRLYARHFTRGYRQRGRFLGGTRRTIGRAGDLDRRATQAGTNTARAVGRGARAVVLAPVLGPQAISAGRAAGRARATAASRRARARLDQARTTRQQWTRNVRHPIQAVRTASPTAGTSAARRGPAAPTEAAAPRRGATGERGQQARAAWRDRSRERAYPLRQQLDAWQDAAESRRPTNQADVEDQRQADADARQRRRDPSTPDDLQDRSTDDPQDGR